MQAGFLVSRGLITQEILESAVEEQKRTNKSVGRILIDRKVVDEAELMAALAAEIGMDFVELDDYPVDSTAATLIPYAKARRYTALPVGWDEDRLIVAMADPGNLLAVEDIRTITQSDVKTVLATRGAITAAIENTASPAPPG